MTTVKNKILGSALGIVLLAPMSLSATQPAAAQSASGRLEVDLQGRRNDKGWVRLCLTAGPFGFPDCSRDPRARKANLRAPGVTRISFEDLPPGDYAFSVVHDENGNEKVDFRLGIPREGVAFSNNAPVRLGPPKYAAARFKIGAGTTRQRVKFKYWL